MKRAIITSAAFFVATATVGQTSFQQQMAEMDRRSAERRREQAQQMERWEMDRKQREAQRQAESRMRDIEGQIQQMQAATAARPLRQSNNIQEEDATISRRPPMFNPVYADPMGLYRQQARPAQAEQTRPDWQRDIINAHLYERALINAENARAQSQREIQQQVGAAYAEGRRAEAERIARAQSEAPMILNLESVKVPQPAPALPTEPELSAEEQEYRRAVTVSRIRAFALYPMFANPDGAWRQRLNAYVEGEFEKNSPERENFFANTDWPLHIVIEYLAKNQMLGPDGKLKPEFVRK